jgi:hypothetical protein
MNFMNHVQRLPHQDNFRSLIITNKVDMSAHEINLAPLLPFVVFQESRRGIGKIEAGYHPNQGLAIG